MPEKKPRISEIQLNALKTLGRVNVESKQITFQPEYKEVRFVFNGTSSVIHIGDLRLNSGELGIFISPGELIDLEFFATKENIKASINLYNAINAGILKVVEDPMNIKPEELKVEKPLIESLEQKEPGSEIKDTTPNPFEKELEKDYEREEEEIKKIESRGRGRRKIS